MRQKDGLMGGKHPGSPSAHADGIRRCLACRTGHLQTAQLSSYGTRQKACAKKTAAIEPRLIDVLYPSRTLRPYCVSRLSTSSLPGIAGMPPGRSTQQEAAAQAKDPA